MNRVLGGLVFFALCTVVGCSGGERAPKKLTEASANFDLEDVEPFLTRMAGLIPGGFDEGNAALLAGWIAEQPVESEKTYVYAVVFDGTRTDLEIVAFMDDYDAPDISFTHPELARRIDLLMRDFFEEAGK